MDSPLISLDTWLISDTHFGHKNIIKYCSRPQNCDRLMIDNWKRLVDPNDTVLHLGDLVMTGQNGWKYNAEIFNLPGHKYLLKGNHDRGTNTYYKRQFNFEVVGKSLDGNYWLSFEHNNRRVILSHFPWSRGREWHVNVHGHIHNNGYSAEALRMNKDHRNISVEVMNYEPVRLRDV